MALHDGSLEDAGRDYYARQFDARVRNVRKGGAAPPAGKSGGLATRGAWGGGFIALFVVVRIIIAVAAGVGESNSSSSYNNYNYTPPPSIEVEPPPPPDWNNNLNGPQPWRPDFGGPDQKPWILPGDGNPPDKADGPLVVPPDDPVLVPPAVPDDGDRRPGKDD